MPTSGRRCRCQTYPSDVSAPVAEAIVVFAAISAMRGSVAASVEPALNPNHPKPRISVPMTAMGRLCPWIMLIVPSLRNFPMRGPMMSTPASAVTPPVM